MLAALIAVSAESAKSWQPAALYCQVLGEFLREPLSVRRAVAVCAWRKLMQDSTAELIRSAHGPGKALRAFHPGSRQAFDKPQFRGLRDWKHLI
jgi:hypothetical protein